MKKLIKTFCVIMAFAAITTSCTDNSYERVTYTANTPVYMPFSEFRGSFRKTEARDSITPGKIYFKDNYLFVNDPGKGIHVIDNANPSNPQKIAFYEILGNVDIAINGNILFADSYIDLVAIDISDVNNPQEVGRLKNVFPEILPQGDIWFPYARVDRTKGVITGWKVETVTEEHSVSGYSGWMYEGRMDFLATNGTGNSGNWSGGAGIAGSMARFMLNEQNLYVVSLPFRLKTVNVASETQMVVIDSVDVMRNMETLFKLQDKLFIGTTTGMLIFDLANPQMPRQIAEYNHINSCDPVVVDGQYAYVTLRTGTICANGQNLLEVIDISSITNPYLVKSYPMFNPHGLGIDGNLLFICDGNAGLKVYDKTNPLEIISNQLAHFADFNTYDVIPYNGVLMLIGSGGIYQYDYSDPSNLTLLSQIPIYTN